MTVICDIIVNIGPIFNLQMYGLLVKEYMSFYCLCVFKYSEVMKCSLPKHCYSLQIYFFHYRYGEYLMIY